MSTAMAFDQVAVAYDGEFGENPVARRIRRRVWGELFRRLPASSAVLDLGCGTGIDACELVRRGHRVVAADGSRAMLGEVQEKRDRYGLASALELVEIDFNDRGLRRALFARTKVDAVLSNFGALNCVQDIETFAEDLADFLPPGVPFVAVVLGKLYPWEVAYHLLKGRPGRAFERLRVGPVSVKVAGETIPVHYYSPGRFCRRFRRGFDTVHLSALGAVLPPPYLARRLRAAGVDLDRLTGWDERLGPCWPVRALGDHFLAVFRRKR